MAASREPLAIPLPTGLPIGLVNAYLLEGDPLTLVDAGPKEEAAEAGLRAGLKALGHSMADIELVLVTHGHVDHAGLAEAVRRESGARVLVPEGDRATVERYTETFAARRRRFRAELLRAGAPEATAGLVDDYVGWAQTLGEPAKVDGVVREGDRIVAGGRELRAVHTPGHTAGSTCYLAADGALLGGDTMLRGLTPNAAFGGADGRAVGLVDYLASLRRLEALPITRVLPGHREPFGDVKGYVRESMARFRERQAAVLALLAKGPCMPFELVVALFAALPIEEILLGLTEVLGHLEVLEAEGRVTAREGAVGRTVALRPA